MQLFLSIALFFFSHSTSALPELRDRQHRTVHQYEPLCDLQGVYKIMNSSLTTFMDLFQSPQRPKCYHWCTNGCSWSPDTWVSLDPPEKISFKPACARHDFAWHNLKKFGGFDEGNKLSADEHLRNGLTELCGPHKACSKQVANFYFHAVRASNEPTTHFNTWDAKEVSKKIPCTIFPGCCADHSDPTPCGPQHLPGHFEGDKSCVAQ